uniref:Uncharacterized protein n=1 Tax=Helianthus annuus TaxID=4232 RepID=A0A251RSC2_HELAN
MFNFKFYFLEGSFSIFFFTKSGRYITRAHNLLFLSFSTLLLLPSILQPSVCIPLPARFQKNPKDPLCISLFL